MFQIWNGPLSAFFSFFSLAASCSRRQVDSGIGSDPVHDGVARVANLAKTVQRQAVVVAQNLACLCNHFLLFL